MGWPSITTVSARRCMTQMRTAWRRASEQLHKKATPGCGRTAKAVGVFVGSQRLTAAWNAAMLRTPGVDTLRSAPARRPRRHIRTRLARICCSRLRRRQTNRPGSRHWQQRLSGGVRIRGEVRTQLPRTTPQHEGNLARTTPEARRGKAARTHHGRWVEREVLQLPQALQLRVRSVHAFTASKPVP